jgi:DNA polymerase
MAEQLEGWLDHTRNYLDYQVRQGFAEILLPVRSLESECHKDLETIRVQLGECTRCRLSQTRTRIVFGEGNPEAMLMFIGEGPGAEEDSEGRPFVGKAGRLLSRMIKAMGLDRSQVYIANIVKCRPPENRDPHPVEIDTCFPFLVAQIESVRPEIIVALGRIATGVLLRTKEPIGKLRGAFHNWKGIAVMPTYHPSFLLRQEVDRRYKALAWADLKKVMGLLDLPVSS